MLDILQREGSIPDLIYLDQLKSGATGFDTIALREEASRGLLASLNRGTVNLIGKNNTQSAPALAMAA